MQNQFSKSTSTKKKIIRSVGILIGLVIVVTLFFIMLPVGIDYGIESYLKDQGLDQATLEDVDFNPITGRMSVTNLNVTIGKQTVLKIPQATFKIQWTPFIRKRFVLERFSISDAELTVEERGDGNWQIGGIIIQGKKEPAEPAAWYFSFQEATAKNCKIKFISTRLKSDLAIEQAKISKLTSWMPEAGARFEFLGKLNDGNLQLQVDVAPFAKEIMAAGRIQLKGLSLTPFAQLLKPQINTLEGRLDADLNIETRRTAEAGFSHHQKGRLNLQQIRTQIGGADFSNDGLAWDGTVRIDIPKSEKALMINADGQLNGTNLAMTVKNANSQIQQDAFDWKGKIDYAQSPATTTLNLKGALKIQNTNVAGPEVNLSEEALSWKGVLKFSNPNQNAGQHITSEGELKSGPLALSLLQQKIDFEHASLEWQGKFDYAQDKTRENMNADGQIRLDAVKMKSPEINLAEEKLTWKGALQFFTTAESAGQRIMADGALDGSHLLLNLLDRKFKFEHHGLSWKGRLDSGETNDFSSLKAEADVILNDIQILHSETDRRLLNANRFDLQAIKVESLNKVMVSGIALNGLALLADPEVAQSPAADPPPLRIQEVKFSDVQLSQQNYLAIDSVQLNAVKTFVHRDSEGRLPAIDRWNAVQSDAFSADQTPPTASDTRAKEKSDAFGFRIGQIDITGDSGLRFKDESVNPAFGIDLSILEAHLSNLDNSQPEQPASVKLLVSDKANARLSLDGTMQPFAERLRLNWVGKIEALELPPLSPYVIQNTGYRFTSGKMQADLPVKINQNQLDGKIDLILHHPTVERVKSEAPPAENQGKIQISMPLDSALKLLRDKQNNVKLNIPISGDINDPKFSIANAVNRVLAQTLQKSALSYLKFMLGPYGIGLSVAELAYKSASKIRLNPILFAPGSAELDEAAIDYGSPSTEAGAKPTAQKKNNGNKDKTSTQKEPATSTITDAALLKLAKNRTERIEGQLVRSHGIEANRIIACTPKIDSGAEAKPRVGLEI
jgi:hypothetical protein